MVAGEVDAAFSSLGVLRTFESAVRAADGTLGRRSQRHACMRGTGCTASGKAAVVLQVERAGQRIATLVVADGKLHGAALCDDGRVCLIQLIVGYQPDLEAFSTRFNSRGEGHGLGVAPRQISSPFAGGQGLGRGHGRQGGQQQQ